MFEADCLMSLLSGRAGCRYRSALTERMAMCCEWREVVKDIAHKEGRLSEFRQPPGCVC
jgi:hypothetical protein